MQRKASCQWRFKALSRFWKCESTLYKLSLGRSCGSSANNRILQNEIYGRLTICMKSMKKYLSLLLMLFLFAASGFNHNALADTHIYRGRFTNTSDIQTTWDGKHLYNGRFSNTSAIMYTWDGKHLYRDRFTNTSDILYTWDGKYLYKGGFSNTADILYTFDGKHLYRGRFTNTSYILLTFGAPVPVIIMLLKTI